MVSGASEPTQLDALQTVNRRLLAADSEQEISNIVIDSVASLFDVEFGGLWLYDEEDERLRLTVTNDARLSDNKPLDSGSQGLLWDVFEEGSIKTIDEGAKPDVESPFESEMILPVGESGVLKIGGFDADAFDSQDRRIASILADTTEAALNNCQTKHELRVKNERLQEFVSVVSHDLRNPLSVADGNVELARTERDSEPLRKASSALDRMGTLVDNLTSLAEQGFVVTERETIDLETLARDAWSNVETESATLSTAGTITLYGQHSQLLQVFENLFRNAVQHGGPEVTVRVGPLEPLSTTTRGSTEDRAAGFYIEDNGPGIPESAYSDVFESGQSTGSTGLGLAIVERIVVAHGWEIACKDPVRGGARFEITGGVKPIDPFERE